MIPPSGEQCGQYWLDEISRDSGRLFGQPLGPRDDQIALALGGALQSEGYGLMRQQVIPRDEDVLRLVAERLATLSVRRSDVALLRLALVALLLGGLEHSREALIVYSPVGRAAEILGLDWDSFSLEVAQDLDDAAVEFVSKVRPQPLSLMGYVERTDGDGFRFEYKSPFGYARVLEIVETMRPDDRRSPSQN